LAIRVKQEDMKFTLSTLAAGLCLFVAPAHAQYSSDPANNLAVAGAGFEEAQPKLVPTADGGCYISWYASDPAGSPAFGYDVRLQRLNAAGQPQWAAGGILIADRGFSSTQDYDLAVDPLGNALLAFRDDRSGGTQVTATLVTSAGLQLWGPTGMQLTNTTDFVAAPKICGTTDNYVIVGWTQGSGIRLQRLDLFGLKTWATDVVLTPATGSYTMADMHASDSGAAIFSWVSQSGGFTSPKHLVAQKVSAGKAPLWGAAHVNVFDGGSLQFGNFPRFLPDGAGGAAFAWYSASPSLEVWAQRVDASGNELFPHNGVSASTNATQLRVEPALSFDAGEQELFVAYRELNGSQSMSGISAQKFDATGARQWSASGLSIVPVSSNESGDVGIASLEVGKLEGAVVTYSDSAGFGQDQFLAQRLDDNGALVGAPIPLSTTPASKYRNTTRATPLGQVLVTWQDDASGSPDILIQDLLPKGILGGMSATTNVLGSGTNPLALSSAIGPRIGQLWTLLVDKSTAPSVPFTAVFVYAKAGAPIALPQGEVLIDPTSILFGWNLAAGPGASNAHLFSIPNLIDIVGLNVTAQAVLVGGLSGDVLTNALTATIGL
jgi:hypothetical protein